MELNWSHEGDVTSMPLDEFLEDVCTFLDLDGDAAGTFTQRVKTFFEENLIFNVKTLLTTADEAFLREGKVLPLWCFVKDLQVRAGVAAAPPVPALAVAVSTTIDAERIKTYEEDWAALKNPEGTVTIASDCKTFFCKLCRKTVKLRRPDSMKRHCDGPHHQGKLDPSKKRTRKKKEDKKVGGKGDPARKRRSPKKKKVAMDDDEEDNDDDEDKEKEKSPPKSEEKRKKRSRKKESDDHEQEKLDKSKSKKSKQAQQGEPQDLPDKLPKRLFGREVQADGSLTYWCKWGRGFDDLPVPLATLVEHYGDAIVAPIVAYDTRAKVEYVVQKLVSREGKNRFKVRWQGYPSAFDTVETTDSLGDRADELIEEMDRE